MAESGAHPSIDLGSLSPSLRPCLGGYLSAHRRAIEDAARSGAPGVEVARRYAKTLDGLLGSLACASDAAVLARGGPAGGRVALVAVGGYGRGMAALHSDIDVLFLCDDPQDPAVASRAEGVLYPLWDLGLSIGHAARGVDETLRLAREDIRTATTLLDLRRVSGDASIVDELSRAARRQVFEPCLGAFLDMLQADTEARHERFGASLHLLEPEVKLGRGGLRDLDVARWAAAARWGARETEELVRTGALLSREAEELASARELLWRVRNLLHLRAGRRHDRLTFADQEDLAEELGFVDGATLAVEQFMQAYYRHAGVVARTAERVLERSRPSRPTKPGAVEPVADGLIAFDEHLTFEDTRRLADEPVLTLRLYAHVRRLGRPPYPFARDAISRFAADGAWRERLRGSPEAASAFLDLLTSAVRVPLRRGSLLGELHEVGLLVAMIPELEPLVGRVEHDVYHVYTADVHAVMAVDALRSLARGDSRAALPLASRLAAEAPRKAPLFLAVLLHDIGKTRGFDRRNKGAELVRPIATRLGLSPADVDHVSWLVGQRTALYNWATRRDTSDPDTVADVARRVGTPERLRDLYLLTVAVVSSTNPTAMSSWKSRMLDDLYLALLAEMEEGGGRSASARAEEIRREVRLAFAGDAAEPALEAFVDAMPERYLLANPAEGIRRHARAATERGGALVHVAHFPGPSEELAELLVVTDDRPGLLADVAAVLAANRLSVVTAQIHTRAVAGSPDEAVDVFHVRRDGWGEDPVDSRVLLGVRTDLDALLRGRIGAQELVTRFPKPPAWARRRTPSVDTEVVVDNAVSARFTVVDVFTRDRIGLLWVITDALHRAGVSIALSKIGTEGERAIDVFYVQVPGGGKVQDLARLQKLPLLLREALAQHDALTDAPSKGEEP